ncbi:unnamed protein product [Merluccius merluccius]
MEAGEKEEEETLQTAFKKLRVDAETSLPGTVNVCEALVSRAVPRACPETGGAKPKLGCTKDTWHGCTRKTSRGVSRSQRRRRSKSPILHPPKFTYCSSSSASSSSTSSLPPPGGCLKHQRLDAPEPLQPPSPAPSALAPPPSSQTQLPSPGSPSALASPPVFGACAGGPATPASSSSPSSSGEAPGPAAQQEGGTSQGSEPSDFHALSQLHSSGPAGTTGLGSPPCSSCSQGEAPEGGAVVEQQPGAAGSECRCGSASGSTSIPLSLPAGWQGVEVYSFTGLRDVISECERSLPPPRTPSSSSSSSGTAAIAASSPALASGSPRSCSEQARAYVDDITIEDLSGYMEYFLYIPKKMSHMAEMMYT